MMSRKQGGEFAVWMFFKGVFVFLQNVQKEATHITLL